MKRPAGTRSPAARRRVIAIALGCGLTLGGCLVTDSVEPPPEPSSPPVVTSTIYPQNQVILFDATKTGGLKIPVEIRDEDTSEILAMRWRVLSGTNPPPAVIEYLCPENPIPGNGTVNRDPQQFIVERTLFLPGSCSVVELVVSAHFVGDCLKDLEPTLFDKTTNRKDNDAVLGRAYFWVWEISNDPLTDNAQAQRLLSSCPKVPYQATTPTPETTTMPVR